jgi:hypothetical protein
MDFVVSFTSHFRRAHFIEVAIAELKKQSVMPTVVVVNLASDVDFELSPELIDSFPAQIEVNRVEDYGPATKLLPTLLRYPEMPIITIDDDAQYRPDLFEDLLSTAKAYPGRRIAARARLVPPGARPWLFPYFFWPKIMLPHPVVESRALPLGAEGVLYPPHSLDEGVWEIDTMMEISPRNDDLWFWAQGEKRSPGVVVMPHKPDSPRRLGSRGSGLWQSNRGSANNAALKNLLRRFPQETSGARSPISFTGQLLANLIDQAPRKFRAH